MSILWSILIGFVVGVIAKLLHPGKENMGIILTTVLGIAGSLIATFLGRLVGFYKEGEAAGFIMALIGAIVLLVIFSLVKGKAKTA
ncbi:MAG: GlsB/YeaQ/YmgE family stress response membrane protein [Holophagales bacterium]|nr:GlsB/YeaQ/YmgE family stress response membrane protein [Holophagales bacterium]